MTARRNEWHRPADVPGPLALFGGNPVSPLRTTPGAVHRRRRAALDVAVRSAVRVRGPWRFVAGNALAAALFAAPGTAAGGGATGTMEVAVKAALLFNFAKFAEWPALASGAPIIACIVGDDPMATALADTVRAQQISGHPVEVRRSQDSGTCGSASCCSSPMARVDRPTAEWAGSERSPC